VVLGQRSEEVRGISARHLNFLLDGRKKFGAPSKQDNSAEIFLSLSLSLSLSPKCIESKEIKRGQTNQPQSEKEGTKGKK
jgi:hypothetical protein